MRVANKVIALIVVSLQGCGYVDSFEYKKEPDVTIYVPANPTRGPTVFPSPNFDVLPRSDEEVLAASAMEILKENCSSCHDSKVGSGNFGSIENLPEMLASGRLIIPGRPDDSVVYQRIQQNMPPGGKLLNKTSREVLKAWITKLKPPDTNRIIRSSDLISMVSKDLKSREFQSAQNRKGVRYFSLHVPHNQNRDPVGLNIYKKALFKVLNSVSASSNVIVPRALDSTDTVFAVRLSDFGMTPAVFDQVIQDYYPFTEEIDSADGEHQKNVDALGTKFYLIRADWFAATAPLPLVYKQLLKHPASRQALESSLGIDLINNIKSKTVMRSGFLNSGVSSQNRMIERHLQSQGRPYWISYDFSSNVGKSNIFANPFGPPGLPAKQGEDGFISSKLFDHDGGEVIYQLPNGLFAYFLANGNGNEIDRGPINVVQQDGAPRQFVSSIVNGISCMNCHHSGLIFKEDQIRSEITKRSNEFNASELEFVKEVHPFEEDFRAIIESDNIHYRKALKQMGIDPSEPDPVNAAFRLYNADLTTKKAVNELAVEDNFISQILQNKQVIDIFGVVFSRDDVFIRRDQFQNLLGLLRSISIIKYLKPNVGDYAVHSSCMIDPSLSMSSCLIKDPIPSLGNINLGLK